MKACIHCGAETSLERHFGDWRLPVCEGQSCAVRLERFVDEHAITLLFSADAFAASCLPGGEATRRLLLAIQEADTAAKTSE